MLSRRILGAGIVVMFLTFVARAAPAGGTSDASIDAQSVELFFATTPPRRYQELRLLQIKGGRQYALRLIEHLRQQAAQIGADALVNIRMYTTRTCEQDLVQTIFGWPATGSEWLWAEGVAVHYVR